MPRHITIICKGADLSFHLRGSEMMLERDWDEARFYSGDVEDHREAEAQRSHGGQSGGRIRQIQARLSRLARRSMAVEDERGLIDLAQQLDEVASGLCEIVTQQNPARPPVEPDGQSARRRTLGFRCSFCGSGLE